EQSLPVEGDLDSLASQEDEHGDNLLIWIDGEEHWISGVDDSTTCSDLICALLSYRSLQQQQMSPKEGLRSHSPAPAPAPAVHGPEDYAIVEKQRNYEEYLDGSARLRDVIASRHALPNDEKYQLQLRHLATATATSRKHTPTTDKDSGMGSPVDSSRSMRFRRRGKSKVLPATMELDQWGMTKANPKQPKRSRRVHQQQKSSHTSPNESLLNIILAQDETILQQMSLLHDKDRQILKIEEEKHRVRERELGKNYLLETYLKDIEEIQENGHPARQSFVEDPSNSHEDENDFRIVDRQDRSAEAGNDEIRLYWLEKIHAVNKDLQREEELLISLHAKVRRHQVKQVYETKSEVLVQIDKLDTQLAAQVADIHRVERKLFTANEQLKAKLGVLESLGREFETTVSEERFVQEEPQEAVKLARLIQSSSQADEQQPGDQSSDLDRRCRLTQKDLTARNLNGHQKPNNKGLTKLLFKGRSSSPNSSTSYPFVPVEHLGTLV
ncbi:hypothetical protein KR038_000465, partial [Drosophila bunnanda]